MKSESKKANTLVVADIETILAEKILLFEDDVIHNLANELQKQDRKLSISTAIKRARLLIDNLEYRVCGKDLISELSRWSQENYKVLLSPIKLANNLEKSEINDEIIKIITSIEGGKAF